MDDATSPSGLATCSLQWGSPTLLLAPKAPSPSLAQQLLSGPHGLGAEVRQALESIANARMATGPEPVVPATSDAASVVAHTVIAGAATMPGSGLPAPNTTVQREQAEGAAAAAPAWLASLPATGPKMAAGVAGAGTLVGAAAALSVAMDTAAAAATGEALVAVAAGALVFAVAGGLVNAGRSKDRQLSLDTLPVWLGGKGRSGPQRPGAESAAAAQGLISPEAAAAVLSL